MIDYEATEHLRYEIDRLREANYRLREISEEQKRRIKRMEKAGNEMATYAELGGIPLKFKGLINAWREAVKYE